MDLALTSHHTGAVLLLEIALQPSGASAPIVRKLRCCSTDYSDASGRPQPSEANVLAHIQALEDAGYRVVGTQEALRGEEYVVEQVQKLETQCNAGGVLDCEVWLQKGNGNHE